MEPILCPEIFFLHYKPLASFLFPFFSSRLVASYLHGRFRAVCATLASSAFRAISVICASSQDFSVGRICFVTLASNCHGNPSGNSLCWHPAAWMQMGFRRKRCCQRSEKMDPRCGTNTNPTSQKASDSFT